MPELPEVETIRRGLAPLVVGKGLGDAWAFPHPKFLPALDAAGARVAGMERRGKYLLLGLEAGPGAGPDAELVVHLGMTGSLRVHGATELEGAVAADPYVRAWWHLGTDEVLAFRDVRRFGRLAVVEGGRYRGTLAGQGPDALDPALGPDDLWRALRASRRAVKTQLLSQRPVAGVGNIYADEALWLAGIDPRTRRVGRERAGRLLEALREVLVASLGNGGTTLRDYRDATGGSGRNQVRLACYGRSGQPCRRCGGLLRRVVLDGRSTTFCPSCQR